VSRAQTISLVEAARRLIATDELRPQARRAIAALLADFDRWRSLVDVVDHVELVETVLDESGYTGMWQNDKSPEAPGRLENLKELVSGMEEFEDLGGFLEHVSLVMEAGKADGGEMVSLMTLHAAKGLEFDNVFLPGWEEGVFPNQRTLDEGGAPALEEERRLAYVGITRARKRVMASFAANRRIYNQWQSSIPSRFIDELPSEHVETVAEQGLYGGNAGYGGGMGETDSAYQQAGRGPGYGRLRAARGSGVIDGSASTVHELSSPDGISLGMRVFHQKFGYGKVTAVDGNKLDIAFEKAGAKKVMDSFVTPA
jgi:DNA helicase-2/ATP-dependent DNA helicase PcrA